MSSEQPTTSNPTEQVVMLRPMSEAPKDGTKIIIMWNTPNNDINDYDIRVAWWWTPTYLHQWERGARPCWEYISDNNYTATIKEPLGWLPKPKAI
jgi:hypothetical protein